jgi:hypothetical protein
MSKSQWEIGYDHGYYEGLRNAIRFIAGNIGTDVHEIIKLLAKWRDESYELHMESEDE